MVDEILTPQLDMKECDEDEEEYDKMTMGKEDETIFHCIIVPISIVLQCEIFTLL